MNISCDTTEICVPVSGKSPKALRLEELPNGVEKQLPKLKGVREVLKAEGSGK